MRKNKQRESEERKWGRNYYKKVERQNSEREQREKMGKESRET